MISYGDNECNGGNDEEMNGTLTIEAAGTADLEFEFYDDFNEEIVEENAEPAFCRIVRQDAVEVRIISLII